MLKYPSPKEPQLACKSASPSVAPRRTPAPPDQPQRWRTRLQALPFLACALLLIATGRFSAATAQNNAPPADPKGSLVLFDFGDVNEKQTRHAAIARFNKRYPNVKVNDYFTPISSWSDYYAKVLAQVVPARVPDLIHIATEAPNSSLARTW
jgi:ABC-type glycerol-3-phosphate transport system substrate-binding protein